MLLTASSTAVTLATPSKLLRVAMDATAEHTVTVKNDGNVVALRDDTGLFDSVVNDVVKLASVEAGVGKPSAAPADTFIDYYAVTSP